MKITMIAKTILAKIMKYFMKKIWNNMKIRNKMRKELRINKNKKKMKYLMTRNKNMKDRSKDRRK